MLVSTVVHVYSGLAHSLWLFPWRWPHGSLSADWFLFTIFLELQKWAKDHWAADSLHSRDSTCLLVFWAARSECVLGFVHLFVWFFFFSFLSMWFENVPLVLNVWPLVEGKAADKSSGSSCYFSVVDTFYTTGKTSLSWVLYHSGNLAVHFTAILRGNV